MHLEEKWHHRKCIATSSLGLDKLFKSSDTPSQKKKAIINETAVRNIKYMSLFCPTMVINFSYLLFQYNEITLEYAVKTCHRWRKLQWLWVACSFAAITIKMDKQGTSTVSRGWRFCCTFVLKQPHDCRRLMREPKDQVHLKKLEFFCPGR